MLEVRRSGYYAWLKGQETARELANRRRVQEIHRVYAQTKKKYSLCIPTTSPAPRPRLSALIPPSETALSFRDALLRFGLEFIDHFGIGTELLREKICSAKQQYSQGQMYRSVGFHFPDGLL